MKRESCVPSPLGREGDFVGEVLVAPGTELRGEEAVAHAIGEAVATEGARFEVTR